MEAGSIRLFGAPSPTQASSFLHQDAHPRMGFSASARRLEQAEWIDIGIGNHWKM